MTRACAYCAEPSITTLDGEDLCIRHANEWVHSEGQAAHEAEMERRAAIGTPASSMNGNAAQAHLNPDAWDRWVAFCEANGSF